MPRRTGVKSSSIAPTRSRTSSSSTCRRGECGASPRADVLRSPGRARSRLSATIRTSLRKERDVSDPTPGASGDLQFDRVEPAEGQPVSPTACAACQKPLVSFYYQVNGRAACERCKTQIQYDEASGSAVGNL